MPIFSVIGQRSSGRPHNTSALGRHMLLVFFRSFVIAIISICIAVSIIRMVYVTVRL